MKHLISLTGPALALAALAAFASPARSIDNPAAQVPAVVADRPTGTLGQSFVGLSYGFANLDDTGTNLHTFSVDYNRAVEEGLDTHAEVTLARSTSFAGGRYQERGFGFGGRFYQVYDGVKPFLDAGIGWTWAKGPAGWKDNSFVWQGTIGVECPVAPGASVSPYLQYRERTSFADGDRWNYGVKGNYWVNDRTAVTAAIERAADESWEYRVGVDFRF